MNWRDKKPTEKQLRLIADIQEFSPYSPPLFRGTTRGKASDYIDKYGELAHEDINSPTYGYQEETMSNWVCKKDIIEMLDKIPQMVVNEQGFPYGVDAIPIEWIENYSKCQNIQMNEQMIRDWRKEEE